MLYSLIDSTLIIRVIIVCKHCEIACRIVCNWRSNVTSKSSVLIYCELLGDNIWSYR
jgi:hypothetical protein